MKVNPNIARHIDRTLQSKSPTSASKPDKLSAPTSARRDSFFPKTLDNLKKQDLKKLAGVKSPGLFNRLLSWGSSLFEGINVALAIGPTVGHLIVAKELSRIQAGVQGKPELSPMDWLRENRPKGFSASFGSAVKASNGLMENSVGLSLNDLNIIEEHYYRSLAPALNDDGIKSTAPFLRELASTLVLDPGEHRPAFVFLGPDKTKEAESVTQLWNSENKPAENPFTAQDPRSTIWSTLEKQSEEGRLPIFVDIDGDFNSFTGTELVAKKTLSSLGERHNSLGDNFADTGRYFAWLTERQEAYSKNLQPYFEKTQPHAASLVREMKESLTPPWLDGKKGMGPWAAPDAIREIPNKLDEIKTKSGRGAWLDSLISLDRDVLTGVQTHWIKLLRELKKPDRSELLEPLPKTFIELNLSKPSDKQFWETAPSDAPGLSEIVRGKALAAIKRPYDRSIALKEVIDHSLDGLGVEERRHMLAEIKNQAQARFGNIEAREQGLREQFSTYKGLDTQAVLNGDIDPQEFKENIALLREAGDAHRGTSSGHEARRHACLLEFLYEMDHRYGETDKILSRIPGDFSQKPLGVSEYFIPPQVGAHVSPLREPQALTVGLGNQSDPNPLKMSMVLEGGGGRGFAFVECLKQFENAFPQSNSGYEVDEFVGTSAGSITAILLAASYRPDEIGDLISSVDFTSFNSDAAWLMGGVDPKVRGINRTGLFSMQKMYQTFQEILGKKLGVEGRPVLFSDLPHKLKLVSTLVNSDLPEESALRESLDSDGRFVFGTDSTPNFDVVGAMISSAAVPAFFQLPQMLVAKPLENGEVERNRLQFTDGGVVDNLSLSSASQEEKERALIVLPAHSEARDPETGEIVGLDTLNFSTENLDLVDQHNRQLYKQFTPKLDNYLEKMKGHGVERAVIGFNLTHASQQNLPVLQGSSERLSLQSIIHAKELNLPSMEKNKGDAILRTSQRPPSLMKNVIANLFDKYLDDQESFHRTKDGFHFHPAQEESANIFDVTWAVGGAALSASDSEYKSRKFQKDLF